MIVSKDFNAYRENLRRLYERSRGDDWPHWWAAYGELLRLAWFETPRRESLREQEKPRALDAEESADLGAIIRERGHEWTLEVFTELRNELEKKVRDAEAHIAAIRESKKGAGA